VLSRIKPNLESAQLDYLATSYRNSNLWH
jgi:hypothetical protein